RELAGEPELRATRREIANRGLGAAHERSAPGGAAIAVEGGHEGIDGVARRDRVRLGGAAQLGGSLELDGRRERAGEHDAPRVAEGDRAGELLASGKRSRPAHDGARLAAPGGGRAPLRSTARAPGAARADGRIAIVA